MESTNHCGTSCAAPQAELAALNSELCTAAATTIALLTPLEPPLSDQLLQEMADDFEATGVCGRGCVVCG